MLENSNVAPETFRRHTSTEAIEDVNGRTPAKLGLPAIGAVIASFFVDMWPFSVW
jgi:hypothetical protein